MPRPRLRLPHLSNRTRAAILAASALMITLGPIAATMLHSRDFTLRKLTEVQARDESTAASGDSLTDPSAFHELWFDPASYPTPAHAVAAYRAQRNPIVDVLLPEGEGGTRFFTELPDAAGIAISRTMTIGMSLARLGDASEATEIHERAHLLHFNAADEVAELIRALGSPAPDTYAAENSMEHFAEMASKAWQILVPPKNVCTVGGVELLRASDIEVPGTAGFVVWFGEQAGFDDFAERESVMAEARRLSASTSGVWERIRTRVEDRRLGTGEFRPWERLSVEREIRGLRDLVIADRGWYGAVEGVLLWPSIWVAGVAGL